MKGKKVFHPRIYFNNQPTERSVAHKHLELNLDERLLLTNYMNNKNKRALKSVVLLQISPAQFPLESFFTIYRSFIRLPQDYGVIYDKPLNESLSNRTGSAQCKAALAVTGVING